MYWNRFDICEAYYMYAMLYHRGQWSAEYKIFGRLNRLAYVPGPNVGFTTENSRAIFDNLAHKDQSGESIVRDV